MKFKTVGALATAFVTASEQVNDIASRQANLSKSFRCEGPQAHQVQDHSRGCGGSFP